MCPSNGRVTNVSRHSNSGTSRRRQPTVLGGVLCRPSRRFLQRWRRNRGVSAPASGRVTRPTPRSGVAHATIPGVGVGVMVRGAVVGNASSRSSAAVTDCPSS
jgi:hypothetical protein